MFHYLVYASKAIVPFTQRSLGDLLEVSRQNNQERNVTGMLLYIDGRFMQVLEGRKEDVEFIFRKIRLDTRHKNIHVIIRGNTEKRNFNAWYMSFKSFTASQFEKMSGFRDLETFFRNNTISNESHVTHIFLRLFFNKHFNPVSFT